MTSYLSTGILIAVLFLQCAMSGCYSLNASVFVLGSIHADHDRAALYTAERLDEVYHGLRPEVLCVETLPAHVADGTFRLTPREFKRRLIPSARRDGIQIVGIDWWDDLRGQRWKELQAAAFVDPRIQAEMRLASGLFDLLGSYFRERDFAEIDAPQITDLWAAKNAIKYAALFRVPEYREIVEFERERNEHMVMHIMTALKRFPGARALVAVGIDHKYYLERALARRGIRVLQVDDVLREWRKGHGRSGQ